jgi:Ser/Thr protein kinase RdoA (MazF antagonist)
VARRKPFDGLSRGGQTRRIRPLVEAALRAYPIGPFRLTRVPLGFNTAFRLDAADGARYVLRVHRPDGPTTAMVRSELIWLAALRRETDLVAPAPLQTSDGDLLTAADPDVPEPRTCDLLHWVDGRFVDAGLTPAHLHRVGGFMARLQNHAAQLTVADGFQRGLVDNVTHFARAQPDNLSPDVAAHAANLVEEAHSPWGGLIVRAVLDRARQARDALRRGLAEAFGLIHADLHQENYLFQRTEVRAIDFDDCGYGPFVYDLSVTLSELQHRADYPTLRAALLAGYRTVRPLDTGHEELIDTFIALRHLQLMMYAVEHRHEALFRETWAAGVTKDLRRLDAFVGA